MMVRGKNPRLQGFLLVAAGLTSVACLSLPSFSISLNGWPLSLAAGSPPPSLSATTAAALPVRCSAQLPTLLSEAENSAGEESGYGQIFPLVTFLVSGDSLSAPEFARASRRLQGDMQNLSEQEQIWKFFTDMIPAGDRTELSEFEIFTDGPGGVLGAVEQTSDPHDWMLEVDIEDAASLPDLTTTLVHEFGHLLTLNDSQVTTDWIVFNHPADQMLYAQEQAACPTYFVFQGCSRADSYLNRFFQKFWSGIYSEWLAIDSGPNGLVRQQELAGFRQKHADQFVSEYAATSPSEDIAESFMSFVLGSYPSGSSVADQKILFFYSYPELVQLRSQIDQAICPYLPP
jgi:hypothetical protein